MTDEARPDDWVAEVLEDGAAVLGVESGIIPIEDGILVAWIRRRISEDTASLARDRAARRTYHVTTLGRSADGSSTLTSEMVPGAYLGLWLDALTHRDDDPVTVLSVEVV
jgi:hypothetical protein